MLLAAFSAALLCLSIALPAQQPSSALPYTVVTREARRPLATRVFGGQEMFALDDLARLFNLSVREDAAAGGITIASGTQSVVLSQQQPLASVAGKMISLPAAAVRDGRAWYVPVDFVSRALASIHSPRLELRKPSRLLLVGDIRMPRVAARVEPLGSLTRVTLEVAPPTPHTVTQEGQQRLIVRFDADALDAPDIRATVTTDTLQNIRAGEAPQSVTIDLGPRFASFRSADQPGPAGSTRVVIDLVAQTETAPPPGTPTPAPTPPPTQPETPPLLDLPPAGGLRTIVIDAGHGGDDTGAKGAQGTLEKTVTLSVARRLKAAIETRLGVRVLLTRDGDQAVASDQRAALANNNKADLFISLHANASVRPRVAGIEVFYLTLEGYGDRSAARDGGTRRFAARARRRHARHRDHAVGNGAGAAHRPVDGVRARGRSRAARPRADEPAAAAAGAAARAGRREHAGGARRDGLPHQPAGRAAARRRRAPERDRAGARRRDPALPRRADRARDDPDRRRIAIAAFVVFGRGRGWVLFVGLPRWYASRQAQVQAPAPATPAAAPAAAPRRRGSQDHRDAVLRRRRRHGARARAARGALRRHRRPNRRAPSSRRSSRAGARRRCLGHSRRHVKLRDVFLTERGDAFVDLSGEIMSKHPGGSLDEIFTVYSIVNALTVNLPAITRVQILVDGKEVDTLAGHVDLRHPLAKSLGHGSVHDIALTDARRADLRPTTHHARLPRCTRKARCSSRSAARA